MNKEKVEIQDKKLEKVNGGRDSLGAYSDWYDLISTVFSSSLALEQKENRLNEMKSEVKNDNRLTQIEKDELYNYINGLLGNGR